MSMIVKRITAERLCETIGDYPDLVEMLIDEPFPQWCEITHIANHRIIDGVWTSTGEHIYIRGVRSEWVFELMDELTIRYETPDQPLLPGFTPGVRYE